MDLTLFYSLGEFGMAQETFLFRFSSTDESEVELVEQLLVKYGVALQSSDKELKQRDMADPNAFFTTLQFLMETGSAVLLVQGLVDLYKRFTEEEELEVESPEPPVVIKRDINIQITGDNNTVSIINNQEMPMLQDLSDNKQLSLPLPNHVSIEKED